MAKLPEEKTEVTHVEKIGRLAEEATAYLSEKEAHYKEILEDIVKTLEQVLSGQRWMIHGRVKGAKSLREKILRKGYYKDYRDGRTIIEKLPDLIGVRVQCLLNREEIAVYDLLQSKRDSLGEEGCFVYQTVNDATMMLLLKNQPEKQKNGHDIYRIGGRYCVSEKTQPVHFELQIKSMVHSFWGELEHSMFYKNYDYFVSQKILTQSMDNILAELDLIDREMEGLQSNFSRKTLDRINELKGICVSVIQKAYQDRFNQLYGCVMDLRAAYWLIVEIYLNQSSKEEKAVQKLSEIIQSCKNTEDLNHAQQMISQKLDLKNVSSDKKRSAKWLDQLVKENVYWEAFFCIYVTLKQEDDFHYKDWIEYIVGRLQRLKILNYFTADFSDNDFSQNILHALILGSNGKLEYFMEEQMLEEVQQEISEALKGGVFEKYKQECEQENFDKESALESVFLWTRCLIDYEVHGHVKRKMVEDLKECLNKENIFLIDMEGEQILEYFDGAEKLSGQKAEELHKKLFGWEEEV